MNPAIVNQSNQIKLRNEREKMAAKPAKTIYFWRLLQDDYMGVEKLHFGDTRIDVYPDSTCIIFSDGTTIPGAPENTDSYRQTAAKHGYGDDTLKLCQEHEVLHIALCHWLGIESPTMTLLRHGDDDRLHYLNGLEECAVLSIQHLARAAGVDLIARMKEWSASNGI